MPTINKYLDLLEGSFLIRRLQPYYVNLGKRLVKSPKIYIRDSGILHNLAYISSFETLLSNPLIGASWEGYVIEQIRRAAPERWQFSFYRTHTGTEADLVLESPLGNIYIVEVKISVSTKVGIGFYNSAIDLKVNDKFIIVKETDSFPKADGTLVCSLNEFLKSVFPTLK